MIITFYFDFHCGLKIGDEWHIFSCSVKVKQNDYQPQIFFGDWIILVDLLKSLKREKTCQDIERGSTLSKLSKMTKSLSE